MTDLVIRPANELSAAELGEFVRLIAEGGEVDIGGLEARVRRAYLLAFVREAEGGPMVSVGALKQPAQPYIKRIGTKSGHALTGYTLELGWVHTASAFEGRGYGTQACKALLERATGKVFATTRTDNCAMRHINKKLGFSEIANAWESTQHPGRQLTLWIR